MFLGGARRVSSEDGMLLGVGNMGSYECGVCAWQWPGSDRVRVSFVGGKRRCDWRRRLRVAVLDGVFNVEVAVVECAWTSCSCVKKVPKMMTASDLHGRFVDCLQAAVADSSFVFCKYVHVSSLSHSTGVTAHATCRPRRETCGVR